MPSNLKSEGQSRKALKRKKTNTNDRSPRGSDSDLELDRELYPIGHYLSDRTEMVEQMFGVLTKDKILSMLPPLLKEINWQDLKSYCLEQLNSMSEKQITRILEGKPYTPGLDHDDSAKNQNLNLLSSSSSSSSSTSSSSVESSPESGREKESEVELQNPQKNVTKNIAVKSDPDKVDDDPDMLQIGLSATEMGDLLCEGENIEKKEKKKKIGIEKNKNDDLNRSNSHKNNEPEEGKTLLEILELEMRARAIRALLKQAGSPEKSITSKLDEQLTAEERSKTEGRGLLMDLKKFPFSIKEEDMSDEDDVVFVSESQLDTNTAKDIKIRALKKNESFVTNEVSDRLQYKHTDRSSILKGSVVDTSRNSINKPRVKPQLKVKHDSSDIILIDGGASNLVPDSTSASVRSSRSVKKICKEEVQCGEKKPLTR